MKKLLACGLIVVCVLIFWPFTSVSAEDYNVFIRDSQTIVCSDFPDSTPQAIEWPAGLKEDVANAGYQFLMYAQIGRWDDYRFVVIEEVKAVQNPIITPEELIKRYRFEGSDASSAVGFEKEWVAWRLEGDDFLTFIATNEILTVVFGDSNFGQVAAMGSGQLQTLLNIIVSTYNWPINNLFPPFPR